MHPRYGVELAVHSTNEQAKDFPRARYEAHDMEMTIANHHSKSSSSYEFKKDKGETKKSSKSSKASTKETMTTSIEKPV